jgi:sporulation protein YlmC with PRC-barrel domain
MNGLWRITLALVVPLLIAAPAGAQQKQREGWNEAKDKASFLQARASELKGKKVVGPQGNSLGEVEEVLVDVRRGAVSSLAVSTGGKAGIGDKHVLVPPKAFKRGELFDRLVLDMDENKLREQPSAEKQAAQGTRKASDLMGQNVTDKNGKAVGEIEDFVVHLGTGRVAQVVFAPDGRKAPEQKRMLPMSAFTIPEQKDGKIVLK